MSSEVSNRLEKLETKIDRLSDAVIAIARIEERVTTVLKQNDREIEKMDNEIKKEIDDGIIQSPMAQVTEEKK